MTYTFHPDPNYAWVTRKGDTGEAVAALQVNLHGVAVDGRFGSQTATAVRGFQEKHHLIVDGIAGLATQQMICVAYSRGASVAHDIPAGLLKSLVANESGFALAAFSWHPSDTGFDVGAYQDSIEPDGGSQDEYRHAYTVKEMAEEVAARMADTQIAYAHPVDSWYLNNWAGGNREKMSWLLAVLEHNFPLAAEGIAERGSIYRDAAKDVQEVEWVVQASGGSLKTSREWCSAYVAKATCYVNWA